MASNVTARFSQVSQYCTERYNKVASHHVTQNFISGSKGTYNWAKDKCYWVKNNPHGTKVAALVAATGFAYYQPFGHGNFNHFSTMCLLGYTFSDNVDKIAKSLVTSDVVKKVWKEARIQDHVFIAGIAIYNCLFVGFQAPAIALGLFVGTSLSLTVEATLGAIEASKQQQALKSPSSGSPKGKEESKAAPAPAVAAQSISSSQLTALAF